MKVWMEGISPRAEIRERLFFRLFRQYGQDLASAQPGPQQQRDHWSVGWRVLCEGDGEGRELATP